MAGIYIHIPYCKQKCNYCNFFSQASERYKEDFLNYIYKEAILQSSYLQGELVDTLYFGGGTPSLFPAQKIGALINRLHSVFNFSHDIEVTMEANPDDLTYEYLKDLKASGINRLSIGVQSFHDDDLKFLYRSHSANQAEKVIIQAQDTGLDNISVDLIYGIPGLSQEKWAKNLEMIIKLDVPHLSAYWLTIETKTTLELQIKKGLLPPIDEQLGAGHLKHLMKWAHSHGFQQYEISNFCKDQKYSRHNSSYWNGQKYLGLGPAAHSFDGQSRQWNIASLSRYIEAISKEIIPAEKEVLSKTDLFNEYVMTSLRTMQGIQNQVVLNKFGKACLENVISAITPYINAGFIESDSTCFKLTEDGIFQADGITAALFITDEL